MVVVGHLPGRRRGVIDKWEVWVEARNSQKYNLNGGEKRLTGEVGVVGKVG